MIFKSDSNEVKPAKPRQNTKTAVQEEVRSCEGYVGRQERRIADQAPRKTAGGTNRTAAIRDKNLIKVEEKKADPEPLTINLKNFRYQETTEEANDIDNISPIKISSSKNFDDDQSEVFKKDSGTPQKTPIEQ